MSNSKRSKSRKIRRLKAQLKYFKSTLSEMTNAFLEYEDEWLRDSMLAMSMFSKESTQEKLQKDNVSVGIDILTSRADNFSKKEASIDSNNDNILSKDAPQWAKDIFRKIAKRTHPDIVKSEDMIEEFRAAIKAMDRKKYSELIDIALDLGIDPDLSQTDMIEKIETRIKSSKNKIEKIEKSLPWIWGESYGIDSIRLKVMKAYLNSKGINTTLELDIDKFVKSLVDD